MTSSEQRKSKGKGKLIYSPKERIPLGEPVRVPGGGHGIRFKWKRGKKNVTEVVALDKLHELVMQSDNEAS